MFTPLQSLREFSFGSIATTVYVEHLDNPGFVDDCTVDALVVSLDTLLEKHVLHAVHNLVTHRDDTEGASKAERSIDVILNDGVRLKYSVEATVRQKGLESELSTVLAKMLPFATTLANEIFDVVTEDVKRAERAADFESTGNPIADLLLASLREAFGPNVGVQTVTLEDLMDLDPEAFAGMSDSSPFPGFPGYRDR